MNKLFEFVDKVYVINLIDREDRKDKMIRMFNEMGLTKYLVNRKIEFVEAIKFPGFTPKVADAFGESFWDGRILAHSPSMAMCTFEHYRCLKKAQYYGYKNILILEDDIRFIKDDTLIDKAVETIPSDYMILHLEGNYCAKPEEIEDKKAVLAHNKNEAKWENSSKLQLFCTGALIYSRDGVNRMVEELERDIIGIDWLTFWLTDRCYFFNYPIANQGYDWSDITNSYIGEDRDNLNVYLTYTKKEEYYGE